MHIKSKLGHHQELARTIPIYGNPEAVLVSKQA
jgi:hypothetical protein